MTTKTKSDDRTTPDRLDDLQCRGFVIYQNPDGYCFTSDSILLANLAKVKRSDRVVDLCSGSGVIGLLVRAKYEPKEVVCVELQPRLAGMAKRSVEKNGVSDVHVVCARAQGIYKDIGTGYDVVTVNPPYEPKQKKDAYSEEDVCKTEAEITLEEVVEEGAKLLRYGGLFYMVNRARRLSETLSLMSKYGIEPKKLYLIQPKKDKAVDAFVVEGKRGGKPALEIPAPIVVYDENGVYTPEVRSLYNQ